MKDQTAMIEQTFVQNVKHSAAAKHGLTIIIPADLCRKLRERPSPLNLGYIIMQAVLDGRANLTLKDTHASVRCPACNSPQVDQLPHGITCRACGYYKHTPKTTPIKLPDYNGTRKVFYQPGHGASGGKNSR